MVAEVGFFIALHQIIVVVRRKHSLLLELLDLAVSAAQKRSTGAFLLAYPLPPPSVVEDKSYRSKRKSRCVASAFSFGCGGGI